ncbi:hypothetical protein JCM5296_004076 [Sporobolomyces johnsonii]
MSRDTPGNLPHTDLDPYGWESGHVRADRTPRQKNTKFIGRPTKRKDFVSAADVFQGAVAAVAMVASSLKLVDNRGKLNIALGGRSPLPCVAALVYWARNYNGQSDRQPDASAPLFHIDFPTVHLPIELRVRDDLVEPVLHGIAVGKREARAAKPTFSGLRYEMHEDDARYGLDVRPFARLNTLPFPRHLDELKLPIVAPTTIRREHDVDGPGTASYCVTVPFLFFDTLQQLERHYRKDQSQHGLLFILRMIFALDEHALANSGSPEWSISSPEAADLGLKILSSTQIRELIDWASDHLNTTLATEAAVWEAGYVTQASDERAQLQDELQHWYHYAFDQCQVLLHLQQMRSAMLAYALALSAVSATSFKTSRDVRSTAEQSCTPAFADGALYNVFATGNNSAVWDWLPASSNETTAGGTIYVSGTDTPEDGAWYITAAANGADRYRLSLADEAAGKHCLVADDGRQLTTGSCDGDESLFTVSCALCTATSSSSNTIPLASGCTLRAAPSTSSGLCPTWVRAGATRGLGEVELKRCRSRFKWQLWDFLRA